MNEIWKDIPEYEGLYQVSNLGNVKSLPKEWTIGNGGICKHNGIILKIRIDLQGYFHVGLTKNGKCKTYKVHKLVAIAFLNHKPCGHKLVVDHINDIKTDNRVENLQIVTTRFNTYKTQGKYSSKYKGVYILKLKRKLKYNQIKIYEYYRASIVINKKVKNLGIYKDEYEAHLAYQKALNELI